MLENFIGFIIDLDPGPILLVQPREADAEAFSKDRLAPMIRDCPSLRGKIAEARSRDSNNTVLHKKFTGGSITLSASNSPAGLAMRSVRYCLLDEVDRYPASAGSEGDPVNLAVTRTANFWNRKIVLCSTPTVKGHVSDRGGLVGIEPANLLGAVPGLQRAAGSAVGQRGVAGGRAGGDSVPLRALFPDDRLAPESLDAEAW